MRSSTLVLLSLLACGGPDPDKPGKTQPDPTGTPPTALTCSDRVNLEVVPLDAWARPLDATLTWSHAITPIDGRIPFGDVPVELGLTLTAVDYLDGSVTISHNGGSGLDALTVTADDPTRWAAAWTDGDCPTLTLYTGLDHAWFAASADAPSTNDMTFLMDGQEAWQSVHDDLLTATQTVSWTTWFWQSDFGLLRAQNATPEQRQSVTALALLEALPDVERRVLVNRFWGENSDFTDILTTDAALRAHAETGGDNFEVMLQGNDTEVPFEGIYEGEARPVDYRARVADAFPDATLVSSDTPLPPPIELDVASFHQKFIVIDSEIAFVGGMNTKLVDWDTNEHRVFEPLRMETDASDADRQAVADREMLPDSGARKDYMMRIEGPAVQAVEGAFSKRWAAAIQDGLPFSEHATAAPLTSLLPDVAGGVPSQVTQTLPEPWAEMSIRETHAKAFAQATDYIFIEDQYFRAPLLNQVIADRMLAEPDLLLIVITKPVSSLDPGLKYTYLSDEYFRELFPDRYLVLKLETFDLVTEVGTFWDTIDFHQVPLDVHSKLRFVDDRYTSLGSCNFNNRGYLYEGEMVASVLDEAWTTAARRRVFENLVGPVWAPLLSDDPQNNFDVLAQAAEDNAAIAQWWQDNAPSDAGDAEAEWLVRRPSGFVMPVSFSFDYLEVGPDMF